MKQTSSPTRFIALKSLRRPQTSHKHLLKYRQHATGYATNRWLRARPIPPQLARTRLQTSLLPCRSRSYLRIRILPIWTGHKRIEVRQKHTGTRAQILGKSWTQADTEHALGYRILIRHSELAREKMWQRIHLTPLLQAEEDRDQVRRMLADKAREKELLGSETSVYHSDRLEILVSTLTTSRALTRIQVRPTDVCRHTKQHDEIERWRCCARCAVQVSRGRFKVRHGERLVPVSAKPAHHDESKALLLAAILTIMYSRTRDGIAIANYNDFIPSIDPYLRPGRDCASL